MDMSGGLTGAGACISTVNLLCAWNGLSTASLSIAHGALGGRRWKQHMQSIFHTSGVVVAGN
eukprot:365023-Chlamydomonas_euryale.AAC.30